MPLTEAVMISNLYSVRMIQYGVAGIITLEYLTQEFGYLDVNVISQPTARPCSSAMPMVVLYMCIEGMASNTRGVTTRRVADTVPGPVAGYLLNTHAVSH